MQPVKYLIKNKPMQIDIVDFTYQHMGVIPTFSH